MKTKPIYEVKAILTATQNATIGYEQREETGVYSLGEIEAASANEAATIGIRLLNNSIYATRCDCVSVELVKEGN